MLMCYNVTVVLVPRATASITRADLTKAWAMKHLF